MLTENNPDEKFNNFFTYKKKLQVNGFNYRQFCAYCKMYRQCDCDVNANCRIVIRVSAFIA